MIRCTYDGGLGEVKLLVKTGVTVADVETELDSNTGWTTAFTGTTTVTSTVGTSTALGICGYASGSSVITAKFYACSIATTIDGAPFFKARSSVLTSESASTFLATTGQTVAIARNTGAVYKSVIVLPGSKSRLFNGTSDFLEVPDNALLDFGPSDSFSVWALIEQWNTPLSNGVYIQKGLSTGGRWSLASNGTALGVLGFVSDGSNQAIDTTATYTNGSKVLASFTLNRTTAKLGAFRDGILDTAETNSNLVGDLSNAIGIRVGITGSSSTPQAFRLYAWGIYRGALSSAQFQSLKDAILKGN